MHFNLRTVAVMFAIVFLVSCNSSPAASSGIDSSPTTSYEPYEITPYERPDFTDLKMDDGASYQLDGTFSRFDLVGFGGPATGGGVLEDDDAGYVKASNAEEFLSALFDNSVRIIEVMEDIEGGYKLLDPAFAEQFGDSNLRDHAQATMHPTMIESGVSRVVLENRSNLTIFSANASTLFHIELQFRGCRNILIRNLRFDEMWEWDESSKGDYDRHDWNFLVFDIDNHDIWVDHCDFGKVYDGVIDIKQGPNFITISYIRVVPVTYETSAFYREQFDYLEDLYQESLRTGVENPKIMHYSHLRQEGLSVEEIAWYQAPNKKVHLLGSNELIPNYREINVTLHHNLYEDTQDRLPRLRSGNVHVYNIYADGRDNLAANVSCNAKSYTSIGYKLCPTSQALISTEDGALYAESSMFEDIINIVRNNQKDETDIYTGKIKISDSVYKTRVRNNNDVYQYFFRGGSDDTSSPFAPYNTYGAAEKVFSWNGGKYHGSTWTNKLPYSYSYTMDRDVENIDLILKGEYTGAGAGVLNWHKKYWLTTNYWEA